MLELAARAHPGEGGGGGGVGGYDWQIQQAFLFSQKADLVFSSWTFQHINCRLA